MNKTVLVIFIVVIAGAVGYYFYSNNLANTNTPEVSATLVPPALPE